jgi:hypothetical protein
MEKKGNLALRYDKLLYSEIEILKRVVECKLHLISIKKYYKTIMKVYADSIVSIFDNLVYYEVPQNLLPLSRVSNSFRNLNYL